MIARRSALRLALLASALLLPSACGRKSRIDPPEGQAGRYTYPSRYPNPATVVPADQTEEPAPGAAPLDDPEHPGWTDPDDDLNVENE